MSTVLPDTLPGPEYYQHVRPEVAALLPKTYARVLEVGCGTGTFRANLKQEHEYWGIEPNAAVVADAETRLDRVLTGTYDDVADDLPDGFFDLVVCNDVIEHMTDHDAFFRSIRQKMTPDAKIVASIPNVRHFRNLIDLMVRKDWEYQSAGTLDRTHFRFFTEKSLRRSLREHGFEVERFEGLNPFGIYSFWKRVVVWPFALVLGQDVRPLQFGVRARVS